MRSNQLVLLLQVFSLIFIFHSNSFTNAKSTIDPCSSADSCTSLLSYIVPWDSKLSEIAFRFQVNVLDLLAANSINSTIPTPANRIFQARSLLKIPNSCSCVDGIRRSVTAYTVRPADSLDLISKGFGRLVSADQIRSLNGIGANNPLTTGQSISMPLPCTCFNNSNSGVTSVYMSYVVQSGDNLGGIGAEFGATVMELVSVNGLEQPVVDPGDILAVPISACSSANLNWYNESLIVPIGSYALTAGNCIKCICSPSTLSLQCSPSGIDISCSHLQCKDSNLFIGDVIINPTANDGCSVSTCVYRGHYGSKIFRSLANSTHTNCSDVDDYSALSPEESPTVPCISLPPSESPLSNPPMGVGAYGPTSKQTPNTSNPNHRLLTQAPYCSLLLVLSFFLW